MRRIILENAKLTVNLKEITKANILLALTASEADAAATALMEADYLGLGTAGAETFTFDQIPIEPVVFYVDGVKQDWVAGTHYTILSDALTIIGTSTIAENAEVVASYTYESGVATHDEITSKQTIEAADYQDNVALIATLSGSDNPVVCIVKNVLSDGNFEIGTTDKEEATIVVEFSAHWDPDVDEAPWAIRYPKLS